MKIDFTPRHFNLGYGYTVHVTQCSTDPNVHYITAIALTGDKHVCSCKGFNYRGKCKHIDEYNG